MKVVVFWFQWARLNSLCVAFIKLRRSKGYAGSEKPLPTWTKEKRATLIQVPFLPQQRQKQGPHVRKVRLPIAWWSYHFLQIHTFPFFYHSRQTKARPSCQKGKTANRLTELSFPTDTYLTRFHVITVLSEEEKKSAKVIGRSRRRMWMAVYVQWIKEEDMDGSDCVVNRGGGYGWLCLYSEVRRRIWMAVYVQWIEEEDMDGCDCVVNRGGFGWLCMYSESRRRIWMAVFV